MKRFLYEENMKFPARKPAARTWRPGEIGANSRFRPLFCVDMFQRPDAVGCSRRMARILAVSCAAAPAVAAAQADRGGTAVTQTVAADPARSAARPGLHRRRGRPKTASSFDLTLEHGDLVSPD
jgi:hypothetical protein